MKRRFVLWVAPIVLAALMWLGCVKSDPIVLVPEPTATAEPTATPAIATPAPFDLSPYRLTDDGLYDLSPLLLNPEQKLLHIGFSGERKLLLLWADESETTLIWERFDLFTGERTVLRTETIAEPIPYSDALLFYSLNPATYWDSMRNELVLLDADCTSCTRLAVTDAGYETCYRIGDSVLTYDNRESSVLQIDSDGTEIALFPTGWRYRYGYLTGYCPTHNYISLAANDAYTDQSVTLLIDLNRGEGIGQQEEVSFFTEAADGTLISLNRAYRWEEGDFGETTVTCRVEDRATGARGRVAQFTERDYYPTIYPQTGGFVLEHWSTDYEWRYLDPMRGEMRRVVVPIDRYEPAWEEPEETDPEEWGDEAPGVVAWLQSDGSDGRYLICPLRVNDDAVALLLWDIEAGTRIPLSFSETEEPLVQPVPYIDATPARYADRVKDLAERYGITVLIGEAAQLNITTHTAEVVSVEEALPEIDETMDLIETVLAEYPPGFFRKIMDGSGDELIFELCGTIRSREESALDYPSALTFQTDGSRIVVLNVYLTAGMRYTIFHELAHVIDRALDAAVTSYDDPRWNDADWCSLNPKKFNYYFAYNDEDGNPYDLFGSTKYTPQDSAYYKKHKRDSVYFADVYSKTFATEDRAVLMGLLLADNSSDELLSCPHLLAKLQYYAKAIRTVFDPDGTEWSEPPIWEQRIAELQ
ncbi:MAG: hypothetical protein IJK01_07720 [Clostridia bacterium]|nr:hypothetical protein [Clostridia bacterium]